MTPTWAPSPEEIPHLDALRRCVQTGFHFLLLRDELNQIKAAHGELRSDRGVVDAVTVTAISQAMATRTRIQDYPDGHPLWQTMGNVADVIGELLELPPHGTPGAPMVALRSSVLWRPGDQL